MPYHNAHVDFCIANNYLCIVYVLYIHNTCEMGWVTAVDGVVLFFNTHQIILKYSITDISRNTFWIIRNKNNSNDLYHHYNHDKYSRGYVSGLAMFQQWLDHMGGSFHFPCREV